MCLFTTLITPYHTPNLPLLILCPKMPQIAASHIIHQALRAIFKFFRTLPAEPILLNFPLEILSQIFARLPLPSQVCLALSCKNLYRIFSSVLGADELRFPRMSSNEILSSLRMALLIQLEDSRWACCAACQRLHPRREFLQQLLKASPWQRKCRLWSGIVDLCPCIAITPRDRTCIVEYLMGHKQSLNLVDRGLLEDSNGCLRHKCSAYSTVQVIIALSLVEDDKLMACARYEVPYTALVGNIESVYICRHRDLQYWLSTRLQFQPVQNCEGCHTRGSKPSSPDNSELILAQALRDLGRGINPAGPGPRGFDKEWFIQCQPSRRLYS